MQRRGTKPLKGRIYKLGWRCGREDYGFPILNGTTGVPASPGGPYILRVKVFSLGARFRQKFTKPIPGAIAAAARVSRIAVGAVAGVGCLIKESCFGTGNGGDVSRILFS